MEAVEPAEVDDVEKDSANIVKQMQILCGLLEADESSCEALRKLKNQREQSQQSDEQQKGTPFVAVGARRRHERLAGDSRIEYGG